MYGSEREFIRKYQGFVFSIAKKWMPSFQAIDSLVEFDDLVQEVWLGLFEARKRFDEKRFKNKFLTYAWYNVRSRLVNLLKKEDKEFATRLRIAEVFREHYCRNRERDGKVEWESEFGMESRAV